MFYKHALNPFVLYLPGALNVSYFIVLTAIATDKEQCWPKRFQLVLRSAERAPRLAIQTQTDFPSIM